MKLHECFFHALQAFRPMLPFFRNRFGKPEKKVREILKYCTGDFKILYGKLFKKVREIFQKSTGNFLRPPE
jgi:hypothetical protein